MWLSQVVPLNISKIIKLKLIENYKQIWKGSIFDSPKCLNYRILIKTFRLKPILLYCNQT